jgi:HD-GYP domain-containing protein (c-di-GMP phosphodiesterase class II)
MAIDYKKELETAAKTMILVHKPDTLIKMIVRMIIEKVKVSHAGILLYNKEKNSYILTVSRGPVGLRIPAGFARMDMHNPLIRFFKERKNKLIFNNDCLVYDKGKKFLKRIEDSDLKQLLLQSLYQMEIFGVVACIPSYYGDENLLGILLLGKKKDGATFGSDELNFFIAIAQDVAMAIRNAQLFSELELELEKKRSLFYHTTIALAAAIDAKDHYTHGHTQRVTDVSLEIAKKLGEKNKKEFNEQFLEDLHIASLLHDIGKIGIPEAILNKQGPLNPEERKKINEHTNIGVTILQPIRELQNIILGVKYHHERYDGLGYPDGLKGEEIPLIASIISVADAFDAMTSERSYHLPKSKEEAVEEIKRQSGRQFDPQIAAAFIKLFREGKI